MHWSDLGIVLGWRSFGENQRVLTVLTQQYGLHRGMIFGRTQTLVLGWILHVRWKGVSETHLGTFKVDDCVPLNLELYDNPLGFMLLELMCHLCIGGLHFHIPCLEIYQAFLVSMTMLPEEKGLRAYVLFEAHTLCYLGHEDMQVHYFIHHWQSPKAVCVHNQWIHQEQIWKRVGKHWKNWQAMKQRAYHKIFNNHTE
ncbi:DNA repair protein RecO [Holospora curviuscula]|uniref:DNA repair protein RecO n=1 Tax=Holospora curviuscula TaxID=1082868 RepID=A0A2S5RA97_9PROT|nr:recombination protein O N-terminal domain-containing protein [Holospora curviuscula]PPE04223.1 DNA repair protein RecO [Holospora curviuscula]